MKAIMEDPLVKEAFAVLEQRQIDVFTGPARSEAQLKEAHLMVRALRDVRDQLTSIIDDGKLLERRLK